MSLYNLKADGDHWRITKFTADLEVESSYLVSTAECDCPAGHRHICRHRQMLPLFEAKGATRGQFFLDFDRKVWIRAIGDGEDHESTVIVPEENFGRGPMMDVIPLLEAEQAEQLKTIREGHAFIMLDLAGARPPAPHIPNNPAPDPELGNRPKSDLRRI